MAIYNSNLAVQTVEGWECVDVGCHPATWELNNAVRAVGLNALASVILVYFLRAAVQRHPPSPSPSERPAGSRASDAICGSSPRQRGSSHVSEQRSAAANTLSLQNKQNARFHAQRSALLIWQRIAFEGDVFSATAFVLAAGAERDPSEALMSSGIRQLMQSGCSTQRLLANTDKHQYR